MAPVRGFQPNLAAIPTPGRIVCFVLWIGLGLFTPASAQVASQELKPVYWQKRLMFIPYQVNNREMLTTQISKVQLLISRDGKTDWRVLQEAMPTVRGFAYHAPADGQYWFALRHLNRQGKPWPTAGVLPQMRVAIDTARPELELSGSLGPAGKLTVRYQSRDANLRPESLVVEARLAGKTWSNLQLGPPDVSQPDRMIGRAAWPIPHGATTIEVRASIADQAGHRAVATIEVMATGPALQMPAGETKQAQRPPVQLGDSAAETMGPATRDPFLSEARLPSRNWPANNRLPRRETTDPLSASRGPAERQPSSLAESPPLHNAYTLGNDRGDWGGTPAQLVADGIPSGGDSSSSTERGDDWNPPASSPPGAAPRTVNSRTFDVEYDLQSVGPWGVSRVELWGTHDDGRTWQSYGVDSDNRSPVRANVPGAGVYGFRILVDGANGVRAAPPRSGDPPELVVAVDLQPPIVELQSAKLGTGNQAGHLHLTWSAEDANLESQPIGLFYSAFPNGPWSTIAAGLQNTGSYTWRLERHVPDRFFVRLEARDIAGNLATHQFHEPISLVRPRPTGRLRSVRPVTSPQDH